MLVAVGYYFDVNNSTSNTVVVDGREGIGFCGSVLTIGPISSSNSTCMAKSGRIVLPCTAAIINNINADCTYYTVLYYYNKFW